MPEWDVGALAGTSISHMINDALPQVQVALIPVFMREFNLSIVQAGLMVSIPLACGTLTIVFAGVLADKIGHLTQIAASLSIMAFAAGMISLSLNVISATLLLSVILVGNSLFHPAGFTLSSKISSSKRRTTALGFFNAGGILGFALGPFSVGVLLGLFNWRHLYLVWVMIAILALVYILLLRFLRQPIIHDRGGDVAQKSPPLRSILTVPFIALTSIVGLEWMGRHLILVYLSPLLVFTRGFTVQSASIFLGLTSSAGVLGGPLGGVVADRVGVIKWFTASILGLAACTFFILAYGFHWMLTLAVLSFGFFAAGEMASSSSLVSSYVPYARRGVAYSIYFLAINLVSAIAPLLGALIAENSGFPAVFKTSILLMIITLILIQLTLKRKSLGLAQSTYDQ